MKAWLLVSAMFCCSDTNYDELPNYQECYRQSLIAWQRKKDLEYAIALSPSRATILEPQLVEIEYYYDWWALAATVRQGRCDYDTCQEWLCELKCKLGEERWFCRDFPFVVAPMSCCR